MSARRDGLVRLIGVFKLVKASLLVTLGLAGLLGLSRRASAVIEHGAAWLGLFPGHAQVHRALEHVRNLDHLTASRFGAVALVYAAVFSIEGVGLLLGKRWAEWMTVAVTSSFVPLEVYEIIEHFSAGKVAALLLNVAIVIYLVVRQLEDRRRSSNRLLHANLTS